MTVKIQDIKITKRVVQVKESGAGWLTLGMGEIMQGDLFRLFEDAEMTEPVKDRDGHPHFIATAEPRWDEMWAVEAEGVDE